MSTVRHWSQYAPLTVSPFLSHLTLHLCPPFWLTSEGEHIYADAAAFIPDRWTTRPELVRQQGAFAPFSTGPYGCIGRPLAMLNLRTTLIQLLREFDFELEPDQKDKEAIELGATEHFTLAPGPLLMTFHKRKDK